MGKNTYQSVVYNTQIEAIKNILASLDIDAEYKDSFFDNNTSVTIHATEAKVEEIEKAMPGMFWMDVTNLKLQNRYL